MFKKLGVSSNTLCSHAVMRKILLEAHPGAKLWEGQKIEKEDLLIQFLSGCDAAIIGFEPVTDKLLSALPELKIISKFGAGCEKIDFEALKKHNIRFGYTFGVNKLSVAELTLSFMISGLRWVTPLNLSMRNGERPKNRNGRLLTGRTIGIHGCGNIGKEVVRLLKPFGCTILSCDIKEFPDFYKLYDVKPVSFEELLERSEILSLHLPKTRTTIGLYSEDILRCLKPDCVLINTCRGQIVDEFALQEALKEKRLAAACFDVFANEPAVNDELLNLPNLLATPHIGASSEETRIAMVNAAIKGLTENHFVEPSKYYDN